MSVQPPSTEQNNTAAEQGAKPFEIKRKMLPLLVIIAVLVLCFGVLAGYGIGRNQSVSSAAADQMASKNSDYNEVKQQIIDKREDLDVANRIIAESSKAQSGIDDLKKQHSDLEQQVKDKQAELDGLTQKVNAAKKASISDGTWQVGTDIDPGTYRANSEVPSDCYWEVLSGDSIVKNDLPGGGFPQTSVSAGQQLKLSSCGTWTKQ
ncbi:MAG: hypothetical protein ABF966_00085 [Bifidobacterium psychraerophilum]|uniref:hypothetical protein n=1 Tax=Bifidobacterium psychraerophilum TaxID=218140 RepID=UPI0039ECDF87